MSKLAFVWLFIAIFFLLTPVMTRAQSKQIKGSIVAANTNEPLAGVSIHVKGKARGTSSQADGTFTLTVDAKANILVISYVGYEGQEIPIGPGPVNVTLRPSASALSSVIVVGYGSLKRSQLTSAVSDVKPEDFNQGGARNVMDLIQGKVSGVNITRTGAANPNSGATVQIRSATSLSGSNDPLIVIDGIPGGNLDLLQQDDIASFDILKDGSAAAIYGTQANGGVILITTKRGRSGPPRFEYNTYISKLYVRDRPDFLTAAQYRAKAASGQFPQMQAYTQGIYTGNTDMYDSVINHDNLSNYHNLSMTGGGPNGSYRASIYYNNFEGIGKANSRQQYGARFSVNQRGLGGRLSSQVDLITNFNKANLFGGGQWLSALSRVPTIPTRDSAGNFYSVNGISNPISDLAQETNVRDQSTNSADAKLTLELYKGLKVGVFGSVMRDSYEDNVYDDLNSDASLYNDQYPGGGYAQKASTVNTNYAFTPTLEYNRTFFDNHNISAVAGYNYQYEFQSNWNADNRGFQNDLTTTYNLGSGTALGAGKANEYSYKQSDKLIAFFGRLNYDFMDKYMLQATFRREGSSKFGANHKWGNFPSVSAGWDISRESFMKQVPWVDQLKLRAGYGVTGNSGIDPYHSLVFLSTGGQYAYPDGVYRQTWGPNSNPNPNLKWEKKAETDIGVDFGLFGGRLTGTIDVFDRRTSDVLFNYNTQLPPYVQSQIYANVGTLDSKGLEIALSGAIIKTKDLTWKMDVTGSTSKNRVVEISNDLYKVSYISTGGIPGAGALGDALRFTEGGAVGNFYGHKYAGLDDNGKWLFYKADNKTKVGLADITEDDKRVIGNALPKLYLSWTNSVAYRNWDLRVFFRGRFRYQILNAQDITYGNQANLPGNVLNSAFTKYGGLKDTYHYSSYYLQPGGFMKLDNITVGYTFKLKTDMIRNLRLYVSGSNLAIFTRYKGNDPDYVADQFTSVNGATPGLDAAGAYPSTRNFLVGLNLGF